MRRQGQKGIRIPETAQARVPAPRLMRLQTATPISTPATTPTGGIVTPMEPCLEDLGPDLEVDQIMESQREPVTQHMESPSQMQGLIMGCYEWPG